MRGQNAMIDSTTWRNDANGPPCQRSTISLVRMRCQAVRLARSREPTDLARIPSSLVRSLATPAESCATGPRNGARASCDCLRNQPARSRLPVRRTRRAARPTSSASIASTSSRKPASGSRPAAERVAASTPSSRKIRGTMKPCDSSSRRQSSRMSGSREAWVCTNSSGRPGAKAATSRATTHERYFCAVDTSRSTSQAGSTASRSSRL